MLSMRPQETKLWSYTTGYDVTTSPTVAGNVYIGSEDGNVYALDAGTGEKLSLFATRLVVDSSPAWPMAPNERRRANRPLVMPREG
jgi:outer membrane protein assembly factor BamB